MKSYITLLALLFATPLIAAVSLDPDDLKEPVPILKGGTGETTMAAVAALLDDEDWVWVGDWNLSGLGTVTGTLSGANVDGSFPRKDTAANIDALVLANRELAITSDTNEIRVGDGATSGGQTLGIQGEFYGFKREEVLVTTPLQIIQITADDHRKEFDIKKNDVMGLATELRFPASVPAGFTFGLRYGAGPLYTPASSYSVENIKVYNSAGGFPVKTKGWPIGNLPMGPNFVYYRHLGDDIWIDVEMQGVNIPIVPTQAAVNSFLAREAALHGYSLDAAFSARINNGSLGDYIGMANLLFAHISGYVGVFWDNDFIENDLLLGWISSVSKQDPLTKVVKSFRFDKGGAGEDVYTVNADLVAAQNVDPAGKYDYRPTIVKAGAGAVTQFYNKAPYLNWGGVTAFTWIGTVEIGSGGATGLDLAYGGIASATHYRLYVDGSDNLNFDLILESSAQTITTTITTGDDYTSSQLHFVIRVEDDSIKIHYGKDVVVADNSLFGRVSLSNLTSVTENTTTWNGTVLTGDAYHVWANNVNVTAQGDIIAGRILTDAEVNNMLGVLPWD